MSNRPFCIVTDSGCDLSPAYLKENNITCMELSYNLAGETYSNYDPRMPFDKFYAMVRAGEMPVTQQVNPQSVVTLVEPLLQQGNDILYLGFSSGLSGTYNSTCIAADELREKYPEAKIITVDTLCASMGQGLMVHKAVKMKKQGIPMDGIASWVEENKLHLVHNFTVDDLHHLHRGGRVSKTAAVIGSALGIKPVLHVDDKGCLIPLTKVRGRKTSLNALVDRMGELIEGWDNPEFFISHGDCREEAEYVADLVRKRFGIKDCMIEYVGPVIGAHSGPGTMALFFMGDHR